MARRGGRSRHAPPLGKPWATLVCVCVGGGGACDGAMGPMGVMVGVPAGCPRRGACGEPRPRWPLAILQEHFLLSPHSPAPAEGPGLSWKLGGGVDGAHSALPRVASMVPSPRPVEPL